MYLTLTINHQRHVQSIKKLPVTIGRGPENDIVLKRDSVSRFHAKIETGEFGTYLVDLNSSNGVFVNGNKAQNHTLEDGDLFSLGDVVACFHDEEPEHVTRRIFIPPKTSNLRWYSFGSVFTSHLIAFLCVFLSGALEGVFVSTENILKAVLGQIGKASLGLAVLTLFAATLSFIRVRSFQWSPLIWRYSILVAAVALEQKLRPIIFYNFDFGPFVSIWPSLFNITVIFLYVYTVFSVEGVVLRRKVIHSLSIAVAVLVFFISYQKVSSKNQYELDLAIITSFPFLAPSLDSDEKLDEIFKGIESETDIEAKEQIASLKERGLWDDFSYPAR